MEQKKEIPKYVAMYLYHKKQLQDLKTTERKLKADITTLQPEVTQWLKTVPDYEFDLDFVGEREQQFGTKGKLCFVYDKRKEYLSKKALFSYLHSFFSGMYPEKDIDDMTQAAVSHVWLSRKSRKNTPTITRTFFKNKKTQTRVANH